MIEYYSNRCNFLTHFSIDSKIDDFVKYSLFCLMSPLLELRNSTELVNLFEKQVMVSRCFGINGKSMKRP